MTNQEEVQGMLAAWIELTDLSIRALQTWRRWLGEWQQGKCSIPHGEFRSVLNLLREAGLEEWAKKSRAQIPNLASLAKAVTCLGSDVAYCGRCSKEIGPRDDAEACWFCGGDLCVECWEQHGHCGHEEAEKINQRMRERYAAHEEGE